MIGVTVIGPQEGQLVDRFDAFRDDLVLQFAGDADYQAGNGCVADIGWDIPDEGAIDLILSTGKRRR